jgi:FkbM family methyltransferase
MVTHSFHGVTLSLFIEDETAANWYDYDWAEMPEVDLLSASKLRPGARVLNVGAHQAVVAMVLAACVGKTGRVIAVEPDAHSAAIAARNVRLNGMEQVTVIHGACDTVSGHVRFTSEYRVARANDRIADVTPSFSVDELAATYGIPDVIFIDVEGYECKVLAGAQKTLAARPDCFIEVHVGCGLESYGGSVEQLVGYFPHDRFRLLEADPENAVFSPFGTSPVITRGRFYLAAIGC